MRKTNLMIIFFLLGLYTISYLNFSVATAETFDSSNLSKYGIKSEDEAKKDFDKICRGKWTKRGVLNNEMYNYCYKVGLDNYYELIYTLKNSHYTWLSSSLPKIVQFNTERDITKWDLVNYIVDTEIDAYLDIEYMREHKEVSDYKLNSCFNEWKDNKSVWNMTRYCLKND